MNPAQLQFLQQQVGKMKSNPTPVRGFLSRTGRQKDAEDTTEIKNQLADISRNFLDDPARTTQLFQALQGMPLPGFPVSGA